MESSTVLLNSKYLTAFLRLVYRKKKQSFIQQIIVAERASHVKIYFVHS